jgi:PAS domain S-box-containing protein
VAIREPARLAVPERHVADSCLSVERALEAANAGTFEIDAQNGRVVSATAMTNRLFGLPEEFEGTLDDYLNRIHSADRDRVTEVIQASLRDQVGHEVEYRVTNDDGQVRWITSRAQLVIEGGRVTRIRGTLLDATRGRHAEELVRNQLAEIEAIYRTAPVGLCVLDHDLRFVRINERLAEINGYPAAEHIGRSIREVVPDLADEAEPIMRRILETGEPVVDIEIVGETAAQPGVRRAWLETWAPLLGESGEILGINVMAEEVTERKRSERLREAFVGLLSHELRTPVTTIYGAANLLSRDGDHADRASLLVDIREEADRLSQLIEDLLVLSRSENAALDLPTEPILLGHELPEIAARVGRRFPGATITLDIPSGLPPVSADPTSLRQVVSNLLVNAAKYAGGEIRLTAVPQADFVELAVTDSGPGFEAGEDERLFDLFYRGKRTEKAAGGTGIGLFIAKVLVEAMGGTIEAVPLQPRGASFRFTIPIAGW